MVAQEPALLGATESFREAFPGLHAENALWIAPGHDGLVAGDEPCVAVDRPDQGGQADQARP